jgi:phosphomevalonate kinase
VDQAERMALSELCQELPGLRNECRSQPERISSLLERIEEEARARRPFLHLLAELLGTPDTARGLSGGLPGAGSGRADEEWFGCPDNTCDRKRQAVPAGPPPQCLVLGQAMTRR